MARLVRWQTFLAVVGILLVGGLLAQFSLSRQVDIVPVRGGTFVEGAIGTPLYLNPLLAATDVDRGAVSLLFEGLSSLQPDGSTVPALAQSWDTASDGTVYTCTLRSAFWHDGEPVTVEDVLFTINLVRSPDFADPTRLAELWSQVEAVALDDRTVRFVLGQPFAPFLSYTTLPILPAHLLREIPPADLRLSTFNLNPVGTGPFRFSGIEEDEERARTLELEANPLYYGQSPYLERIQIRFFRDEGALVEALLRGEVDGAFNLSPEALTQLAEQPDLVAYRTYLQAYTILFLNTRTPLLSDKRIRQALALGLNQAALLRGIGEATYPANGPISPISWAYKPDLPPLEHLPEQANRLLEEAGWIDQDGDGIRERDVNTLELTLLTRDIPPERVILARRIEQQLAILGIAVRVAIVGDPNDYRRRLEERDFDLLLYGWGQLGRDPDEFALWHSSQIGPQGSNLSSLRNEQVDQLLEMGRTLADRDQRTQLYWQFQELFVEEVPALPLYYPIYTYVLRSRVRGVELVPLNDVGDRFRSVTAWYTKTQRVVRGLSRPAQRFGGR